ncbi:hypothetical protein GS498_19375, partial [Rhodococcus hoagii]|nr:hypothetical protein [Prescottella equi]
EFTVNDVLYADQRGIAAEAIVETSWPNVSVIPADLSLAQRDADQQLGAEMRLRKALDAPDLAERSAWSSSTASRVWASSCPMP